MAGSYKARPEGAPGASELAVAAKEWAKGLGKLAEQKDGLFGHSVRITTSSNLNIKSKNLDIEFTVPFDDDPIPNEAEIVVYNLSNYSISQLRNAGRNKKRRHTITLYAGYVDDVGVIFHGVIKKVSTRFEGVDKKTTIFAVDQGADDTVVKESFPEGTKASDILRSLVSKAGLAMGSFETKTDRTYDRSVNVDGAVNELLPKYAAECDVSAYISKGRVYIGDFKKASKLGIRVDDRYGLLDSPELFEEEKEDKTKETDEDGQYPKKTVHGVKVKLLLNHRITTGVKLVLRSKNRKGNFFVRSGTHQYDGQNLTTEVEAIE